MNTILTINSGSSSLKASLFADDGSRRDFRYLHIGHGFPHDHAEAFRALLDHLGHDVPDAVGHRFVHGGDIAEPIRRLDAAEQTRLKALTHLAPLHMPGNLLGTELCARHFDAPQFACFDTAFHATLPELARRLPIPQHYGMRRYGFHGINYAHVARQLPALLGEQARGNIVVAHLGNGASLCLLRNLQSVDTTMGYTAAGGIPMGTRSGDLDPGVMLALAERYDTATLAEVVYQQMGLLALSNGESNEMAELLRSRSQAAQFAVDYFARQVRGAIGAMAARAGGLDGLVFTAGIGEHADTVRALICEPLGFLGIALDTAANRAHETHIEAAGAKPVLIVAADEETEIARLTAAAMQPQSVK